MKVTLLNDSFPPVIDGVANVVMNYAKILQEEKLADVSGRRISQLSLLGGALPEL